MGDPTDQAQMLRERLLDHLTTMFVDLLAAEGHRVLTLGDVVVQLTVRDITDEPDDDDSAVPAAESAGADEFVDVPLGHVLDPDDYLWGLEFFFATADPRRYAMQIDINGLGCRANDLLTWRRETDLWLTVEQQADMLGIGWVPPGDGVPLWWIFVESAEGVGAAADAVIAAVAAVCEVPVHVIAADLGIRPWAPEAAPFSPARDAGGMVTDPTGLLWDYAHFAMQQPSPSPSAWPSHSRVPAAFFAIVDDLDTSSVQELVALAPLGPDPAAVGWFRRFRDGWLPDPTVPRRLDRVATEKLRAINSKTARIVDGQLRFP